MNFRISRMVEEFVKKQNLKGRADERMQLKKVMEEIREFVLEWQNESPDEVKEMADVIITLMVFAFMRGYLDKLWKEVELKMVINLAKPIREGHGMPVRKSDEDAICR